MSESNSYFVLTSEELDSGRIEDWLRDGSSGAHVVFTGSVREKSQGRTVVRLEFDAYEPMALRELSIIESEIRDRWPVNRVALHHRLGKCTTGESAVVAGISSPHRAEAFEACAYLINRLKETVPIWKKEIFDDGSMWVTPNP